MACFLSPLLGSDAFVGRCPSDESLYLFSEVAAQANGARTLVRRNVTTAQTRPQNSNASFAHQRSCGLKSALRRSVARATTTLNTHVACATHAKHIPWLPVLRASLPGVIDWRQDAARTRRRGCLPNANRLYSAEILGVKFPREE